MGALGWLERPQHDATALTAQQDATVATPALLIATADAASALLRPDVGHSRPLMPACEQYFQAQPNLSSTATAARPPAAASHFGPHGVLAATSWQWPPHTSTTAAAGWEAWAAGLASCWARCRNVAAYAPVFRLLRAAVVERHAVRLQSGGAHGAHVADYALCDTLAALVTAVAHVPGAREAMWASPGDRAAVCVDLVRYVALFVEIDCS